MIEVEFKYAIDPQVKPRLEAKLRDAQFDRLVQNSDIYYDTLTYDLLQKAVFFRVRNQQTLQFKFNERAEKAHIESTERTFSLSAQAEHIAAINTLFAHFLPTWQAGLSWEDALQKNRLVVLAHIENTRRQYIYDSVKLCVDTITNIGEFLEVEVECEEGTNTHHLQSHLRHIFGDVVAEPLSVGYVELWLHQHNLQAYHKGVYRLPDDVEPGKGNMPC